MQDVGGIPCYRSASRIAGAVFDTLYADLGLKDCTVTRPAYGCCLTFLEHGCAATLLDYNEPVCAIRNRPVGESRVIDVVMAYGKNRIGRSRVSEWIHLQSGAPTGKRDRVRVPGSYGGHERTASGVQEL